MDKTLRVEKHPSLIPLPKATMNTYSAVCNLGQQSLQSLGHILVDIKRFPLEISLMSYLLIVL